MNDALVRMVVIAFGAVTLAGCKVKVDDDKVKPGTTKPPQKR